MKEKCAMCGALRTEGLGLYCSRCDKTIGDVQADLMAEFGVRDNVV